MRLSTNENRVMEQETISKNRASSKSQMSRGNKNRFFGIAFAIVAISFCFSFTFKSHGTSEGDAGKIIGVWKIVSPKLSEEGNQKR